MGVARASNADREGDFRIGVFVARTPRACRNVNRRRRRKSKTLPVFPPDVALFHRLLRPNHRSQEIMTHRRFWPRKRADQSAGKRSAPSRAFTAAGAGANGPPRAARACLHPAPIARLRLNQNENATHRNQIINVSSYDAQLIR